MSAIHRAKYILKSKNLTYADKNINTYAIDKENNTKVTVEVNFNNKGLPKVQYNKDLLIDTITNDTLRKNLKKD